MQFTIAGKKKKKKIPLVSSSVDKIRIVHRSQKMFSNRLINSGRCFNAGVNKLKLKSMMWMKERTTNHYLSLRGQQHTRPSKTESICGGSASHRLLSGSSSSRFFVGITAWNGGLGGGGGLQGVLLIAPWCFSVLAAQSTAGPLVWLAGTNKESDVKIKK